LEFDLQNSEVVDSSFNYDNPCQDYLYPQDHTQTKFDATFDHFREHKTNNINEEYALTGVNSSTSARFYKGIR